MKTCGFFQKNICFFSWFSVILNFSMPSIFLNSFIHFILLVHFYFIHRYCLRNFRVSAQHYIPIWECDFFFFFNGRQSTICHHNLVKAWFQVSWGFYYNFALTLKLWVIMWGHGPVSRVMVLPITHIKA